MSSDTDSSSVHESYHHPPMSSDSECHIPAGGEDVSEYDMDYERLIQDAEIRRKQEEEYEESLAIDRKKREEEEAQAALEKRKREEEIAKEAAEEALWAKMPDLKTAKGKAELRRRRRRHYERMFKLSGTQAGRPSLPTR